MNRKINYLFSIEFRGSNKGREVLVLGTIKVGRCLRDVYSERVFLLLTFVVHLSTNSSLEKVSKIWYLKFSYLRRLLFVELIM